jgi:hypothetical protein
MSGAELLFVTVRKDFLLIIHIFWGEKLKLEQEEKEKEG